LWRRDDKNYVVTNSGRSVLRLHRLLLQAPDHLQVDHKDLNPLNNQRDNLRLATNSQNAMNRGPSSTNVTGVKGVTYDARYKSPYIARIVINRKNKHLGAFSTLKEAKAAYDKAAEELFGDYAFRAA
jgi:hypothetical protein